MKKNMEIIKMKNLKNLFLIGGLAGSLFIGGCGNNEKKINNPIEEIDTDKIVKYSLKYTALKLIEQGRELDSLNNLYDSLDKRTDTKVDSLK